MSEKLKRKSAILVSVVSVLALILFFFLVPVISIPSSTYTGQATYSTTCSGQSCAQVVRLSNGTTEYMTCDCIKQSEYGSLGYVFLCNGAVLYMPSEGYIFDVCMTSG